MYMRAYSIILSLCICIVAIIMAKQFTYTIIAPTITIALMGDVMLGRMVNEVIKEKGTDYPFSDEIKKYIQHADIALANQEFAFTTNTHAVPKVFNFKSDPDHVETLLNAGIAIVSLANNHSFDFGLDGFTETIHTLDTADIKHVGAGFTLKEAQEPVIITKKGIKIGIIGCTDNEPSWGATSIKPGTFYVSTSNPNDLLTAISTLRPQVDIIILTMHWGPNMQLRPSNEFIRFAHMVIDHGVDIFHGHSAHVPQGYEWYKNKLILYDTGDFVNDYAVDPELRNNLSALFLVEATKKSIESLKLIPVAIHEMQVKPANKDEAEFINKRTKNLSNELQTDMADKK